MTSGEHVSGDRLSDRLDPRRNSINALRLALALAVLVWHSIKLSADQGDEASSPALVDLGTLGVDGFFALSGYLILGSWLSSPTLRSYLWRRCLRILPGFWVCLLVTATVLGPLSALLNTGPSSYAWVGPHSAASYVEQNSWLLVRQFEIDGAFGGLPANGSLHTLFYEFLCYLAIAATGVAGVFRLARSRVANLALGSWLALMGVVAAVPALVDGSPARSLLLRYGSMFLFGALAHLYADRIRLDRRHHLAAVALLASAVGTSLLLQGGALALVAYSVLAPAAVTYLVLALGASTRLARVGSKRDLSYGLYVYAWPVQATLLLVGAAAWWLPVYMAASLALSLGLAYLSWTWVEGPALRLKRWSPRRRRLEARQVEAGQADGAPAPVVPVQGPR